MKTDFFTHIVDLTHYLETGMPTFPGDEPEPRIESRKSSSADDITKSSIQIGSHFGTHMDAPRHFFPAGKGIDDFPPERFIGKALCIRKPVNFNESIHFSTEEIDVISRLTPHWLLVRTGFDRYWGEERYFSQHPYLSVEFAKLMIDLKIKGIGVDFASIDAADAASMGFPVHRILLGKEILVIENLTNLKALPEGQFLLAALPMKIKSEGAPTRVVGIW